jgi:hypothetical protein
MRNLIVVTMLLAPVAGLAQPNGSGSPAPAAGSAAAPAGGSAAQVGPAGGRAQAGSGATGSAAQPGSDGQAFMPKPPPSPADLRQTCVDAMNADPSFAASIVEIADKKQNKQREDITLKTHEDAAEHVAKNERHVILAYAAMWVVAALFVLFLWRRQQGLKIEILRLQKDLAAATKEPEKPAKREL